MHTEDYKVLSGFTVNRNREGILQFLFPQVPFMYKVPAIQFPPYIKLGMRNEVFDDHIELSMSSSYKLDERKGFTEFLKKIYGEDLTNALDKLDDASFWYHAKLCWFMDKQFTAEEARYSTYSLFNSLGGTFKESYVIYRHIGLSHHLVFSALLTMLAKAAQGLNNPNASAKYKVRLNEIAGKMSRIRPAVMNYVTSKKQEYDFISFLYACSIDSI